MARSPLLWMRMSVFLCMSLRRPAASNYYGFVMYLYHSTRYAHDQYATLHRLCCRDVTATTGWSELHGTEGMCTSPSVVSELFSVVRTVLVDEQSQSPSFSYINVMQ
ncbi:hypothetical protein C8Q74DRAFT_415069 [Fomes fomentarius]|nr:hypothetical protein C8Q74DRAFT_415069 [Fomes fomentarius]